MRDGKALITSKTVWGGLIALIPMLAEGLDKLASTGVVPPPYVPVLAAVGGVVAIVGRVLAKKPITGLVKSED